MNHQYNLQFDQLCYSLHLGEAVNVPEAISGGLLHRMYFLETTKGKFAIKALNPQVMARSTALSNFIRSEQIAALASNCLPAQAAKIIDGKSIHCIDQQYYLIFDWIDGYSLKSHEVNKEHSMKMGRILARLHQINFPLIESDAPQNGDRKAVDWHFYLSKGKESNANWVELLQRHITLLFNCSDKANDSSKMLEEHKVISHRDLEPKNVMWVKDDPVIIDWEAAGFVNPMHDLIETAFYWSTNGSGSIDKGRFLSFIREYEKIAGALQADWSAVLELGYLGKLDWLEYNLKRSLWIECTDEKEQQMGTRQVEETILGLKQYEAIVPLLENWLINDIR